MTCLTDGRRLPIPCVAVLGDFDGVHRAHRALTDEAKRIASSMGLAVLVYTFAVNSKKAFSHPSLPLLTTNEEKNALFEKAGVDTVYYEDFERVRNMDAAAFCRYLTEKIGARGVVCGENFTFGKNAAADSAVLAKELDRLGVFTHIVPTFTLDGETVSSTAIRTLIENGEMEKAAAVLGYRYFITARVIHGRALGRKLGFPTVNQLEYGHKVIPKFGVYACTCTVDGRSYAGVVNVGKRPTVSTGTDAPVVFETHILDYAGDLYGKTVTVSFHKMLREEKKFASLDELHDAVMKNIAETRAYFKEVPHE